MKKKKKIIGKQSFSKILLCSILLSLCANVFVTSVTVNAQGDNYGLSNPRKDAEGNIEYDCIYFGNYWQEDNNEDGQANKNDEKTPIKWRVLSVNGDDAFLIADQNLDMQRYNDADVEVTWETCTLRSWLNGYGADANVCNKDYSNSNFIDNAFDIDEKNAIMETMLKNKDNSYCGTPGGEDTKDKIFLLSYEDMRNEEFGFSDNYEYVEEFVYVHPVGKEVYDYWNEETDDYKWEFYDIYDYAKLRKNTMFACGNNNTVQFNYTSEIGTGWWWLRSPGHNSNEAINVLASGDSNGSGPRVNGVNGVCPAIHLNLSDASLWNRAGVITCKPGDYGKNGMFVEDDIVYRDYIRCTVLGYVGDKSEVVIPDKVHQKPVTEIDVRTSGNNDVIQKLTIPASVDRISGMSFGENIKQIIVAEGNENFSSDEKGVLFNKDKTELYYYPAALGGSYEIPDGVEYVDSYAFWHKNRVTELTIPASVKGLGTEEGMDGNFFGGSLAFNVSPDNAVFASDEEGVLFSKDMETLLRYPAGKQQETYTIPDTVKEIGGNAFVGSRLKKVAMQKGVKTIGYRSFAYCTELKNIIISESVNTIGIYAFENCTSLEEIHIPKNVQKIDQDAFENCSALQNITVDQENKNYSVMNRSLLYTNESIGTWLLWCPEQFEGEYIVPECVDGIGYTETGTFIKRSFYNCNKITKLTITKNAGFYANGVSIASMHLIYMENLAEIEVDSNHKSYSSYDGMLFNKDKTALYFCPPAKTGKIRIPGTVTQFDSSYSGSVMVNDVFPGDKDKKTFVVEKGSVAESFVKEQGWKYEYAQDTEQEDKENNNNIPVDTPADKDNSSNNNTDTQNPTGSNDTPASTKVTSITITADSKKIAAGKKVALTAVIAPENATDKGITWTSSNPDYATVSAGGVVTTLKAGAGKTVKITATANDGSGVTAGYNITIMKNAVTSVKITTKAKTAKIGEKLKLKTSIKTNGKKANKALKWTSSNTKYATVSSKGVVTFKKAGKGKTVKITAMATDGSGRKATIKIKIK